MNVAFLILLGAATAATVATTVAARPDTQTAQEVPSPPRQWIDLRSPQPPLGELIAAAARATGSTRYWVGYDFALRPGVTLGCDHDHRTISIGDGDRIVLGESASDEATENAPSHHCSEPFGLFLEVAGHSEGDIREARLLRWRRAQRLDAPIVWAGTYRAEESLAWLRQGVLSAAGDAAKVLAIDVREALLTAAVLHDSPAAVEIAFEALDASEPGALRQIAVMWAAHYGERRGIDLLLHVAREDGDLEVRESSLFWLGQLAGEAATATLAEVAESDPESDIRRTAIFALSQSEDEAAIEELIRIVRTNENAEVVRAALFWLGQSGDRRALALFEEILIGHR